MLEKATVPSGKAHKREPTRCSSVHREFPLSWGRFFIIDKDVGESTPGAWRSPGSSLTEWQGWLGITPEIASSDNSTIPISILFFILQLWTKPFPAVTGLLSLL